MLKKIILSLVLVLALSSAIVYFVLPMTVLTQHEVSISTVETHVFRFLTNKKAWGKWWPGTVNKSNGQLHFRDAQFDIGQITNSGVYVSVHHQNTVLNTKIYFIAADKEKVKVSWNAAAALSTSPFKRIAQFMDIRREETDMADILQKLKAFLEDDRNIYQLDIKLSKVTDSIVLAAHTLLPHYPNTEEAYRLINLLRQGVQQQKAIQTDAPMLNVHQTGANTFDVMAGIPINKEFKTTDGLTINKMVLGNILKAKVIGGPVAIRNGIEELENYRKDYGLISPAKPFESLITDRQLVKDTSKWVTVLYYPIL